MSYLAKTWSVTRQTHPAYLTVVASDAVAFELDAKDAVDFDTVLGRGAPRAECIVYNCFELAQDTRLGLGIGTDYWFDAWLNGQKVWSTMDSNGNGTCDFSPDNHGFVMEGKAGKNVLAIRLRRGTGDGWVFCAAARDAATVDPFKRVDFVVDVSKTWGPIRRMNAVNNGPIPQKHTQSVSNMADWQALKIPFARNHDASFFSGYGGEHTVDVHLIFPDFSKDPEDPASYTFLPTDQYCKDIQEGGTKVFYRLGSKIEHGVYKYGTRVPTDFKKWAVVCEHIIRHYTEGWANGYQWDMQYWEIWNEPELGLNSDQKPTWGGTQEEFFDFFRIVATHLKSKFPHLKIGGPALAGPPWGVPEDAFAVQFLKTMSESHVPLDFLSWHIYVMNPRLFGSACRLMRSLLDRFGYTQTESILNEWNCVYDFGPRWSQSLEFMISLEAAVFISSVMSECQDAPLDMLMYYDARPCKMNGLFGGPLLKPLKGYYAFLAWRKLKDLGTQVAVERPETPEFSVTAACDAQGNVGVMVSRFFLDPLYAQPREISIRLEGQSLWGAKVYVLDAQHNLEEVPYYTHADGTIRLPMAINTLVYVAIER